MEGHELGQVPLYRCSHHLQYVSLTGSRVSERKGCTATKTAPSDRHLARKSDDHSSWYSFISRSGKLPTWPITDEYARSRLLLHWPNRRTIPETIGKEQFKKSDPCPNIVRARAWKWPANQSLVERQISKLRTINKMNQNSLNGYNSSNQTQFTTILPLNLPSTTVVPDYNCSGEQRYHPHESAFFRHNSPVTSDSWLERRQTRNTDAVPGCWMQITASETVNIRLCTASCFCA